MFCWEHLEGQTLVLTFDTYTTSSLKGYYLSKYRFPPASQVTRVVFVVVLGFFSSFIYLFLQFLNKRSRKREGKNRA